MIFASHKTKASLFGRSSIFYATILFATLQACGSSTDSTKEPSIEAPTLPEATSKGLVFAALNHDLSAGNSVIYFYDFKEGVITKLSQGESANPYLIGVGQKVVLFNRHNNLKNYKILDPFTPDPDGKGINLNLADGDPFDAVPIDSNQDLLLLASPIGQKLQTLRLSSGSLNNVNGTTNLAVSTIRPISLSRVAQTVYMTHSGLALSADGVGKADGTQQIFTSTISGESLMFTDLDPSTAKIDGSPLTATFPLFSNGKGVQDFKTLGLCNSQMQGCQAGMDQVQNGKAQKIAVFTKTDQARYVDQFTAAGDQSFGYGLVANAKDETIIGKISLSDGSIEETLKTFDQKRLFGLVYEPGSKTLIIGDVAGDRDAILLYRDNKLFKKIEIDGVLYRGVFVN